MAEVIESIEHGAFAQCMNVGLTPNQIDGMNNALSRGNSIEIHPAKDGVKIYEVKKKVIK